MQQQDRRSCPCHVICYLNLTMLKYCHSDNRRCRKSQRQEKKVARLTGLEPATPGVTGRYSNQLSYNRAMRVI